MQEDGGNPSCNAIDLDLNEAGEEPEVAIPLEEARAGESTDVLDASSGFHLDLNQESPPLPKIEIKPAAEPPTAVPGDASPNLGQAVADADAQERRLRELLLGGVKQEQAVPKPEKEEEEKRVKSRSRSHSRSPDRDEKRKERKRGRSRSRSRSRTRNRKHRSGRQEVNDTDDEDYSRSERRRSRGKPEREDSRSRRKRSRSREERKRRSRSRERSKRERRSRSREKRREEKKEGKRERKRSRSREKKKEKKKKRERSRSRSRSRERSRDGRERKRSRRSRSKSRDKSRDRRRSRSRERVKRWDVKKEDEWIEKQPTLPAAAAGSAAPVVGPAMVPTHLLLARLAGYPSAGLTYPGAPANPLPAPPPAPVQPAHDPEEERRRKLQALAGYGQDRVAIPHEMNARMPMGLGFKPDKHGPVISQPIAPGMSVSVPIGKKNVIFKGWKKGGTVTQDDIKRDTSGRSTSFQSLSDNTKSTVQVREHNFQDHKITGGVGFKMLQKMGWGGDALGKHEDGIVEPIAITMNQGTRGLCGADEQAQGKKKKKKKGGLRGPTAEPPNNPNYNYVKCRFDPNHTVPEQRLAKHELNCPANPNPASHTAQLKRQNMLINSSSAAVTKQAKKQRLAYDRYRPLPAHTPEVGPAPAFAYGHSLPPTAMPAAAAAAAFQQQQYAMWAAYQQQQQQQAHGGWPGAPTPHS